MIVISSFYYSEDLERHGEIVHAIARNANNPALSELHLFVTRRDLDRVGGDSDLRSRVNLGKVRFIIYDNQPTYQVFLRYIASLSDVICCICNSDIEVIATKDALGVFGALIANRRSALFITRHECDGSKALIDHYCGSHDAFIFHSDVLRELGDDFADLSYPQNTAGIEALLITKFVKKHDFDLYNPCHQIKLIHHHSSNIRVWRQGGITEVGYVSRRKLDRPGLHCDVLILPLVL